MTQPSTPSTASTAAPPKLETEADYSQLRFRGGVMRGLLITSATMNYLEQCVANLPANTRTAQACRQELSRREAARIAERDIVDSTYGKEGVRDGS